MMIKKPLKMKSKTLKNGYKRTPKVKKKTLKKNRKILKQFSILLFNNITNQMKVQLVNPNKVDMKMLMQIFEI